jgi:hypothetical protein
MTLLKKMLSLLNSIGFYVSDKLSWVFITLFYFSLFGIYALVIKFIKPANNKNWVSEDLEKDKDNYFFQS